MTPTSRPAAVAIEDLAEPRFPDEVVPVLDLLAEAGAGLTLEPEPLLAAARAQTGLDDFGPDDFRERLDVLCRSLRDEANLSAVGVAGQFNVLSSLLRNRLLIEDQVKRHPEILDVPISRPIVICGLPRTGTTHLHNLMSADPALRSLPYWESLEPVLPEAERAGGGEPDPRWARTEQAVWFTNAAAPLFKRMHEMTVDHVHEEIQLLAIDLSTMLFESTVPLPSWRDYYLSHDQRPAYAYLRKVLQVLQWQRGGTRWVLKSPQHLEQFGVLRDTFPDGTFVVTHRDPVSVTSSLVTMLTYLARLQQARPDPRAIGAYWADRIERMLRSSVEQRDLLPAEQSIDVRFDEFMADDIAMVERIYAVAGQPFTPEAHSAMRQFMVDHPRGKYGGIVYDLATFGLDRAERRAALQFYVDRFGVVTEDG